MLQLCLQERFTNQTGASMCTRVLYRQYI